MPSEKNTDKPKLNRDQLREHGIEFVEKVHKIDELQDWLQPIVRIITTLPAHIPEAARQTFSTELDQFDIHGQDRKDARYNNWCLEPVESPDYLQQEIYTTVAIEGDGLRFRNCKRALKDIRLCHKRNENEAKWTQVLGDHVFLDFHKAYPKLSFHENSEDGNCTYRLSYGADLFTDIHRHQNLLWNEFPEWARLNPRVARVTRPKPDLTYGFPVIAPHDEVYRKFEGDVQVDSFSLPVLGELRNRTKDSLVSAPTTALHRWAAKNKNKVMEAEHLMCYPWAVVEVKRGTAGLVAGNKNNSDAAEIKAHKRRTEFCYCQAANASAAGLTLWEQLATRAKDWSELHDARVMFAFTCVGSAVKLWITYRVQSADNNKKKGSRHWHEDSRIIMVCVWATSIELSWGITALRIVVKNVQEWANLRIKPQISRWIQNVRQNHLQTSLLTPGGELVTQRRRAVSCEPSSERPMNDDSIEVLSKVRFGTPKGKTRPNLPHGQTAPAYFGRKANTPKEKFIELSDHDGEEDDGSFDEGYASIHGEESSPSGDEEEQEVDLAEFIDNDEPSEDDEDADYIPPSSEGERSEDESSEGEGEAWQDDDDIYALSDGERFHSRYDRSIPTSSRLDLYCTPTKGRMLVTPTTKSSPSTDRRHTRRYSPSQSTVCSDIRFHLGR